MTFIQHPDRRKAERFEKALKVRFTVNGGPEQSSDTINFTARSVAIRSDVPVRKNDRIVAQVEDMPEIHGSVIRVFDEGFAICLTDSSLALVTHAGADIPTLKDTVVSDEDRRRILSPVFRADAPAPAWTQITTARTSRSDAEKHLLSLVTTGAIDLNDIHNVWISIDEGRWTAQIIQTKQKNNQSMIVLLLNEWQLRLAAKHGLTVTILSSRLREWQAHLHQDPIADHVRALAPEAPFTPETHSESAALSA